MRGRKYRIPKSILIVSTNDTVARSSRNLTGVDVTMPEQLNIEMLAPGGTAGRLTVFTKSALTNSEVRSNMEPRTPSSSTRFVTEKTMMQMEQKNALEFIVRRTANKAQIKRAVEKCSTSKSRASTPASPR